MTILDAAPPDRTLDASHGEGLEVSAREVSVAELQAALRVLRRPVSFASREGRSGTEDHEIVDREEGHDPHPGVRLSQDDERRGEAARPDSVGTGETPSGASGPKFAPDQHSAARTGGVAGAGFDADWVAILAGHAGAGASSIALALLDALASAGRPARLIETAPAERSSLVAAAAAELGADPSGCWLRGLRGQALVLRRAAGICPQTWPTDRGPTTTVVDLGTPAAENIARLRAAGPRMVLVCRVTVPGLRLTEQILTQFSSDARVFVVAVGKSRWPGSVTSSLGPRLRELRESGHIVTVPVDRRLEVAGLTSAQLPTSVGKAATSLLALLDHATQKKDGHQSPGQRPADTGTRSQP